MDRPVIPWDAATDETVRILCDLLRFDTTNPPGNEAQAVAYIRDLLTREGIEARVFEAAPGRANLVARIPAGRPAPQGVDTSPLMLMGHVDVVEARAEDWSVDPFGGVVKDGWVWGRGALDMKNTVAQFLTLFLYAARTGVPLGRDLIFMANADEEAGGKYGAGFMADQHWDLIACGAALNEGGGAGETILGRTVFTYQTAEKAGVRFTLRTRGRPGHGSIPHSNHAVVHLARAITALAEARMPVHITPTVRGFLEGLAGGQERQVQDLLRALLDPARAHNILDGGAAGFLDEHQRDTLRSLLTNSLAPNIVRAGSKINVIPAAAEVQVDTRILPGQSPESVRAEVMEVLGDRGLLDHCEVIIEPGETPPTESPPDHALAASIRRALAVHRPDALVLPVTLTGGTDACYLRPRGTVVYGFSPLLPGEDHTRVHGIDERISLDSLRFGLEVVWDVMMDYLNDI